jgi:transposase InsO family protein
MIDRAHPLSVIKQAQLLSPSRSSIYYEPVGTGESDLTLMAAMDDIHLTFPFYGVRRPRGELLDRGFCVGRGHGAQFTSEGFAGLLASRGIQISMDGRGRWMDNVFIERLWRSVKYEEVYLKGYESIPEARQELAAYFDFYNLRRRHQGLEDRTPDQVYWSTLRTDRTAA